MELGRDEGADEGWLVGTNDLVGDSDAVGKIDGTPDSVGCTDTDGITDTDGFRLGEKVLQRIRVVLMLADFKKFYKSKLHHSNKRITYGDEVGVEVITADHATLTDDTTGNITVSAG